MDRREADRRGLKSRNFIDSKLQKRNGKLLQLTGYKFQELWKYYDKDGSGFLEQNEFEDFLKDFLTSSLAGTGEDNVVTNEELSDLRNIFLSEFDDNGDGRISAQELMNLLPVEESVYLSFRLHNDLGAGVDYMQIWKKYDRDFSGFIDAQELKLFLKDVLLSAKPDWVVDEAYLEQYSRTILKVYDTDNDGKLGLSELSKLLPMEHNFLQMMINKVKNLRNFTNEDLQRIIDHYDKDQSGYLEGAEITQLAHEVFKVTQGDRSYDAKDVYEFEKSILRGCDVNGDGRIDKRELALIMMSLRDRKSTRAMV